VLVVDKIEIIPPLRKSKYDTWRILLVKCYIDNSMCLRSCIRNVNNGKASEDANAHLQHFLEICSTFTI
jgi:hypothetical protein